MMVANGVMFSLGVRESLARSAREAESARVSVQPAERLIHAHLSALRAAAALVCVPQPVASTRARRRVVNVWDRLERENPELAAWADYFRSTARVREKAEAGVDISAQRADEVMGAAQDFVARIRHILHVGAIAGNGAADGVVRMAVGAV